MAGQANPAHGGSHLTAVIVGSLGVVIGGVALALITAWMNQPTVDATTYSASMRIEKSTCPDYPVGKFLTPSLTLEESGDSDGKIRVGDEVKVLRDETEWLATVPFAYPRFEFVVNAKGTREHWVFSWLSSTSNTLRLEQVWPDGCVVEAQEQ